MAHTILYPDLNLNPRGNIISKLLHSHLLLFHFFLDVCIAGLARTPIGALFGSLSSLSATKLGSIAIKSKFSSLILHQFRCFLPNQKPGYPI
jgi:hypothetical protein